MPDKSSPGLIGLFGSKPRREGLLALCFPEYDQNANPVKHPPYRYMHYYTTKVHNTIDVPLSIVWFQAFTWTGWWWRPGNITGKPLTGKIFSRWYSDDEQIIDGVIPPRSAAVNSCNWGGSNRPILDPTKWAFRAVDPSGATYYAEVVVRGWLIFNVDRQDTT
jgi:hypothetical protein